MKSVGYLLCLLLVASPAFAHEKMSPDADYGFGVTGGFLTGSGFYLRKYFGVNYVQLGGLASAYVKGDENTRGTFDWNAAFVMGRYLNKRYFDRVGFPVGFHVFAGVHNVFEKHTRDDYDYDPDEPTFERLFAGPGFGMDLFNPATEGFGIWITISYAAEYDIVNSKLLNVSPWNSMGISYNW